MINCKKHFIAACFSLIVPTIGWAEAPVVDDSENFAIMDEQPSAARPKYDQPLVENSEFDDPQHDRYRMDMAEGDDGPALAKDDTTEQNTHSHSSIRSNAALIERVQTLQKEIQELRGQLELQAHELKTLQQQQLTFYKDLDSRVTNNSGKASAIKNSVEPTSSNKIIAPNPTAVVTPVSSSASRANPADEQISYLAAYELVKNKQYDDAIKSMQIFVKKYPQSGYSANAQYWLGELFMVKKDYPKAVEHFEIVLHQFPSSSKSAASMLKAGYAYAASGNNQEARNRLQQVVKSYPGTPTAQLANLKLESISAL
jgi:tol-pal system protein YbgF